MPKTEGNVRSQDKMTRAKGDYHPPINFACGHWMKHITYGTKLDGGYQAVPSI